MSEDLYLTDDEKGHFRKWESLFENEGWKLLVEELQQELDAAPRELFLSVKSYEELLAARERLRAVAYFINYEQVIQLRKDHIIHQRRQEAEARVNQARPDY